MVVEPRADGQVLFDHQLNNKMSFQQNLLVGKNGTIRVDVPILSSGDTPKVRLYLRGLAAGGSATSMNHGVSGHDHGNIEHEFNSAESAFGVLARTQNNDTWTSASGYTRITSGDGSSTNVIGRDGYSVTNVFTDVPQAVQIWIDGTEYTATIGDPNTKGATMYDSTNDDWGTNGTTEWNTGELDLSGLISWTVGDHYIEIKETGGTGGTLIYVLLVN